jgi:para-nitrobenzyl esterase
MRLRTAIAASVLLGSSAWAYGQTATATTTLTPASYSQDTPIETLASDPAAAAVLNKDLPGLLTDAQYPIFKAMSLKAIQQASGGDLSAEDVNKTVADLQALPPR